MRAEWIKPGDLLSEAQQTLVSKEIRSVIDPLVGSEDWKRWRSGDLGVGGVL